MLPPSSHPPWQEQPGSLSPLWVSYCAWGQDPTHKLKTEPTKTGPDRQCFASPAPAMRIAIMPRTCTVRLHSPSCKTTGSKFIQVQKMVQILNMAGEGIEQTGGGGGEFYNILKRHGYRTVKWGKARSNTKKHTSPDRNRTQSLLISNCVCATPSIYNQNQMLCNALCSSARKIKASIKVAAWLIWLHLTPSTKTQQSDCKNKNPSWSRRFLIQVRVWIGIRAWIRHTERRLSID